MGVATSNTSGRNIAMSNTSGRNIAMSNTSGRNIAANNTTNNQQPNRRQQTEGFFTEEEDPITRQTNFFNSQFLEYGSAQPNLFIIPAPNFSNVASCNANVPNEVLNNSIFGTLKSIYGTTNTVAITPEDYSKMKENRSNNYSRYYDGSNDPVQSLASRNIVNTESKKQFASPLSRIFDFVKSSDYIPQAIIDGQNFCEEYNSLTKNVEDYYANRYKRENQYGCGFVYNPNYTDPATGRTGPVFRGHYGYNRMDSNGLYIGGVPQEIYNTFLLNAPGSIFYWEMNDTTVDGKPIMGARTAFKQYYCQMNVPNCSNINAYNTECKWSVGLNRAVPNSNTPGYYVESSGTSGNPNIHYQTTYPNYPQSYGNIIENSSRCPPPDYVPGTSNNPDGAQNLPSNCYDRYGNVLTGDNISKACVQKLLSNAGCSNTGRFNTVLESGSLARDYGINNIPSFMRYKQVYPSIGNIFTADETVLMAQRDINELGLNSRKTEYTSINYAARELCLSPNVYANFDFCTEYGPSTPSPFRLECIQQEFRVQGGQKTGLMYPQTNTDINMTYYNNLRTWSDVKQAISRLAEDTRSSDLNTQAIAFNKFYGINAQQFTSQFIPSVSGVEVYWFSITNAAGGSYNLSVFLGRRIQQDLTLNTNNLPTSGIQFISFFNLKTVNSNNTSVQYSFSNTDGIQILENENIGTTSDTTGRIIEVAARRITEATTGRIMDARTNNTTVQYSFSNTDDLQILENENIGTTAATTGRIMAAWTNSPTSRVNTNGTNCWPVSAIKPNYFTVSWYRSGSSGTFNQNYFKTCDATPSNVNATGPTMTMSQEPDAPMISFEVVPDPTENQLNFFSSDKIPNYIFGDPRLWKVLPITDNSGLLSRTSINTVNKFGFSNRYLGGSATAGTQNLRTDYSYMYGACTFTSGSVRKTNVVIQNQSWRTITMLFKTGSLAEIAGTNQMNYLLQYGELSLGIKNIGTASSPVYKFTVVYGTTTSSINTLSPNTTYYIIVMQDFDEKSQSQVTTTLTASCIDVASLKTTNASVPFNGGNSLRYTKVGENAVWGPTTANYTLSIGGTNSLSAAQTVGMDVGWVRFFDYVFEYTDLQDDLENRWKRNWWNMI